MTKFAITLCVVLFASAANAILGFHPVDQTESWVNKEITYLKEAVTMKYTEAKNKTEEIYVILKQTTDEYIQEKSGLLIKDFQEKRAAYIELLNKAGKVDVSECNKLYNHLEQIGTEAGQGMIKCQTDLLGNVEKSFNNIFTTADAAVAKLNDYKLEADNCGAENATGLITGVMTIACLKSVGVRAAISTIGPKTNIQLNVLEATSLWKGLERHLIQCPSSAYMNAYDEASKCFVHAATKCIEEKLNH